MNEQEQWTTDVKINRYIYSYSLELLIMILMRIAYLMMLHSETKTSCWAYVEAFMSFGLFVLWRGYPM